MPKKANAGKIFSIRLAFMFTKLGPICELRVFCTKHIQQMKLSSRWGDNLVYKLVLDFQALGDNSI